MSSDFFPIDASNDDGNYSYYTNKKRRRIYLLLSLCSLMLGFCAYVLFRESDLLINDIFNIRFFNTRKFDNLIFIDFIKYNLPDGLWLLSGILLLRSIWISNQKVSQIYTGVFILIAFLFELGQISFIPGTFDVMDLIIMVIFAFCEQITYKIFIRRLIK